MNATNMTLGERILEIARLATAIHIEAVLQLQPAAEMQTETQRNVVGGAGPWAQLADAHRFTDEVHGFRDEAFCRTDAANDRPHGAVADPSATPRGGAGGGLS